MITAVLFIILLIIIVAVFSLFHKEDTTWKKDVIERLNVIYQNSQHSDKRIVRTAVIDADKLLDYAMQKRKIKGETMGERLKNAKPYYEKELYNRLWAAHKLRNSLVHEMENDASVHDLRYHYGNLSNGIRKLL